MSIADNEIIELFHLKNKKEEAFRLLVDKYKEKLYWHIRKIVLSHEDSNDILQNTFVKIWQGLKEFRYESGLYTWMYRIATNESINFLNEKKRKVYGNSGEITEALENILESDVYFSGDEIQKELQKAVLKLTDRQRLIFNMKYFCCQKAKSHTAQIVDRHNNQYKHTAAYNFFCIDNDNVISAVYVRSVGRFVFASQ